VAIVTGAAGGVGRATVELLSERGARVVAEDVNPAVGELEDDQVATLPGDVAEPDTARRAVALAHERFGALHVLVNNAARFLLKPTVDTTDGDWDELLRVNVRGAFLHCREALPALSEHGDGRIINVASISGTIGLPGQTAYCSTKGAIVQLTRQLAVEHAPRVRVNAVAPGAIDTGFADEALAAAPDREARLAEIAASARARRGDCRGDRLSGVAALEHHHRSHPDGRRRFHRAMMRRSALPETEEGVIR